MDINSKIFIAGHNGMVGSSIHRHLKGLGYNNIITADRSKVDLTDQLSTFNFIEQIKPEYVFLCAAKVGGIKANNEYKGDFIYDNLMIQNNVIMASKKANVTKLLFLGSSCIYPKNSQLPIKEEYLLTGQLEPTNEPYAIAKIAGIKLCQSLNYQYNTNFISVMPTNLYGVGDNYDLNNSHVLPAFISKIHLAKLNCDSSVELWGDGTPMREFLFVDDLAEACVFLMNNYNDSEIINIGTGEDITIKDLALIISNIIGYEGKITFNTNMPNGTHRKVLDVSKINNLGWYYKTKLIEGIKITYNDFLNNDKYK